MKINDVILRTVTRIVVFIILTFGVYLFLSGHNTPGGGFIGGLVLASAIVLLYLSNDIEKVQKSLPLDFKLVAASGVLLATGTGLGSLLFGVPFMSQTFAYFDLPVFGKTELTTVTIFEAGVALAVVGVVVTIILSISEDE
ncbi:MULTISPECIES: Na(+)/H(+) antiporter subunit B [Psychrobacillus]|uniref:Na(+)/H(+) antiporter subunit B n=1 Tax=Psychrobacillus lasiicapitis TaxID=1636719 RepID=A0A544T537_9BACI|nr:MULTISPECIES: Na(+)/H(+) antiporter subunit B [Psychrobacillus]MDI2585927.1 Na(+)/H(+) antiporter subunit B [Psychrobacillus sp. NEAU-3TGS]TQR12561.1 Na(+)/H(+) antiporter subunit B [Psychrobacillus lasiicapitis]GGA39136.1 Na(+)/H(+) antiporter subunit B [Psychrobacillus lasiicapitis]